MTMALELVSQHILQKSSLVECNGPLNKNKNEQKLFFLEFNGVTTESEGINSCLALSSCALTQSESASAVEFDGNI